MIKSVKSTGLLLLFSLGLFVSCEEKEMDSGSLSVSPSQTIVFEATGNEDVVLDVSSGSQEWNYTVPDWVTARKEGSSLIVNAQDNTLDESKAGRIEFTSGAAKQVNVSVVQKGKGEAVEPSGITLRIYDKSGSHDVNKIFSDELETQFEIHASLSEAAASDVELKVFVDERYRDEYDYINGTNTLLMPDGSISEDGIWTVSIAKGETESVFNINIDASDLVLGAQYLLPLAVEVESGNVSVEKEFARINYLILRQMPRDVKQLVCFEFNDVNPLNALEYKLEDGSYFFDAVVLFSGNMGWDSETETVRFNARTGEPVINGNTAALVKEWETYLKPLRDAGIKVYMGIMPHWTEASITKLSNDGCKWFGEEMAQIVKDCQLDGVFLDEEYTIQGSPEKWPEWFANPDHTGSYFAYQMNKQMDLVCDWDTGVIVYQFNIGPMQEVTDHETGEKYDPADYLDFIVGDYGNAGIPYGDKMTLKDCACFSVELNRTFGGDRVTEENCRNWKDEGYGWMMWFAFNPDPTHDLYNLDYSMRLFNTAAKGFYDGQKLVWPTHYYRKISEGVYDPTRYEF